MSKQSNRLIQAQRRASRRIFLICTTTFIAKVLWLFTFPSNALLGADGENYISGVKSLTEEGLFSSARTLHYWPAGYPILIWPLQTLFGSSSLTLVGVIQSLLFATAVYFFSMEIYEAKIQRFAVWTAFILSVSPTLSLNSLVIGYEVPCASLLLIAATLFQKHRRLKRERIISREVLIAGLALGLASFMQPRILLLAAGIILSFALLHFTSREKIKFVLVAFLLLAISPIILVARNFVANDFVAVSTNLGVTMNIGAGNGASGGYSNDAPGVGCALKDGDAVQRDKQLVACVLNWYWENPIESSKLFARKFIYHWSPWFGPLSNGTTARNPWLNLNPLVDSARNTESGYKMVFGSTGVIVSWIFMIFQMILMFYGFWKVVNKDEDLRILAWVLLIPVILNTLSSMATIGDNRFRIPTLTLSIALQAFGLFALFSKGTFRPGNSELGRK